MDGELKGVSCGPWGRQIAGQARAPSISQGTMQGGNVAGGLGLDREFFESILVPQVMLYGFLGLKPAADGCTITPRLPSDWPSLTVTRIHLHKHVLDVKVTVEDKTITVTSHTPDVDVPDITAPGGWTVERK